MNICIKRIANEIGELLKEPTKYKNIELANESDERIKVKICKSNNNIIEFHCTKSYPFKNPVTYLNGRNYRESIIIRSTNIQYFYDNPASFYVSQTNHNRKECICCSTITSSTNWSPALDMQHVLNEIETTNKLKRVILVKLILNRIIDKCILPRDVIPILFEYLMV